MAYNLPTYRTLVCLSDGGVMGRTNPAAQPGGFLKGLPSPFWCSSSFKWQILVYETPGEPANLPVCTATLKARPYNQIAADVLLSTVDVIEGNPGYYNCLVFEVERDTLAEISYSGRQMTLYVEIEADKEEVSTSVDVQTALYQVLELTGPSGNQSETDYAPVPAGRWMGTYSSVTAYWAYDTVAWPDADGIDTIWMNINSSGSTGVEPSDINSDTWYPIVRDYTGAWMTSVSEGLDELETSIDARFNALAAGDIDYTPVETADWPSIDPDDVGDALDKLAERTTDLEAKTAGDIAYTPIETADWPGADPDDAGEALDTLAERVADLEVSAGAAGGDINDLEVRVGDLETSVQDIHDALGDYTPAAPANWTDPDPTNYSDALDLLVARLADLEALLGGDLIGSWENDDIDIGTEVLVSFAAPNTGAAWKVLGIVDKDAEGQIAFEALISLRVLPDGYGGYDKTVKMTLQHTTEDGDCSALAWEVTPGAGDIYTDYDAGTDTVRVRLNVSSDNWYAAGKYIRIV